MREVEEELVKRVSDLMKISTIDSGNVYTYL
jgi:hypothetical protein